MKIGNYVRTDKGEIGKLEDLKLNYTTGKRLVTYYTYREVKEFYIKQQKLEEENYRQYKEIGRLNNMKYEKI